MDWPRQIDGASEALTIEGLRRRLGRCPVCGAGPLQLLLGPARLSARRKGHRPNVRALEAARPLLIRCAGEECNALFRVGEGGRIHPSPRSRQEDTETRLFLPAFLAPWSGDGAELSFELADQADPWEREGISFEESIRRLRETFDDRRAT